MCYVLFCNVTVPAECALINSFTNNILCCVGNNRTVHPLSGSRVNCGGGGCFGVQLVSEALADEWPRGGECIFHHVCHGHQFFDQSKLGVC